MPVSAHELREYTRGNRFQYLICCIEQLGCVVIRQERRQLHSRVQLAYTLWEALRPPNRNVSTQSDQTSGEISAVAPAETWAVDIAHMAAEGSERTQGLAESI